MEENKLDPSHELPEPSGLKPDHELPAPQGLDPAHELPSGDEHKANPPTKKAHWLIFVIGLIILVIISGIVGYFAVAKMNMPSNTGVVQEQLEITIIPDTEVSDPMANWKTYTNPETGFQLKYPPNLIVSEENDLQDGIKIFFNTQEKNSNQRFIWLTILNNPQKQSLLEYWTDSYKYTFESGQPSGLDEAERISKAQDIVNKAEKITVGGKYEAYKYSNPASVFSNILITWFIDNRMYNLSYDLLPKNPQKDQIANEMLSTFKFLDQNSTATCTPRPACLDSEPRCLIPETPDMCPPTSQTSPIVCTDDAKVCPDGTFVGRIGPNCEFAPCPGN